MSFIFKKRVYFCDTDAGGIVYHSKYLDFCEQARAEYLLSFGITQRNLAIKYGLMFVLKECNVKYKNPARAEDVIGITVEDVCIKGPSMTMRQKIYKEEGNIELVECDMKLVAINKEFKLIRKLPEEITTLIG